RIGCEKRAERRQAFLRIDASLIPLPCGFHRIAGDIPSLLNLAGDFRHLRFWTWLFVRTELDLAGCLSTLRGTGRWFGMEVEFTEQHELLEIVAPAGFAAAVVANEPAAGVGRQ